MLEIENHLMACDVCSAELHEKYEDIQFVENRTVKLDNQLFEEEKLVNMLIPKSEKKLILC
jgi:ribosome biogenesis SPOUT family RNA methylase Rps3